MMMSCIQQAVDLFKTAPCAAAVLCAGAFLLGVLVTCLACRLFRPCAKNRPAACKPVRPAARTFEKRHPQPADGSVEIYVGNLSYDLTEAQLRKEFEAYGTVNSARIITNRYTNRSKGFGFIQMPVRAEAEAAVKALNDKDILGRKLKCNEAKNVG
jgi:hypothetical protein